MIIEKPTQGVVLNKNSSDFMEAKARRNMSKLLSEIEKKCNAVEHRLTKLETDLERLQKWL